jgi:fructose-bisphosphate aldolase class II
MRERTAGVDTELVARIAAAVPVPLVLHGSSGVADDVIRAAVAAGIRKVNVGTALNIAGTAAVRATLAAHPDALDPRLYTAHARDAMAEVVAYFARLLAG